MSPWLLLLVLLWPLWRLTAVFRVARALLGIEFPRLYVVALSDEQVPLPLIEATRRWIEELAVAGFQTLGAWRVLWEGENAFDEDVVVLAHSTLPVRALLRPYPEAARSGEFWLELRTTTAEGAEVATVSYAAQQWTRLPPHFSLELLPTNTVRELLARHEARLGAGARTAWRCTTVGGAVRREQSICDGRYAHLRSCGAFIEQENGALTYRFWPALWRAWLILRTATAARKKSQSLPLAGAIPLSNASQIAFDWHYYQQKVALKKGRYSLRAKAILTGISFILFAAAIGWRYSPSVAITLIIAIIIHECGHLAGMRIFGHRDTQLLFIPFFGAAAMARDDKVLRPWQEIVIILLGPLPGIFLGIAILALPWTGHLAWLLAAAWTFIGVNALNLLPALPLDGGQVVDFAVASRFPRARVFFLGGGAIVVLLLGKLISGAWLLYGVGVGLLARLRAEWKLAPVRAEVRKTFPDGGEEVPVVYRLLEHMREPEWKTVPAAQRLELVRGLQRVLRMPRPGIVTMVFALTAYSSPLWLGAPLVLWSSYQRGEKILREDEARATAAGLTAPLTVDTAAGAPDDNAAPLYEKARGLVGSIYIKRRQIDPATSAKAVALLRLASHKKLFAPVAPATAAPGGAGRFPGPEIFSRGDLLGLLAESAEDSLRAQKPVEAVGIAADALWLARLLDAAPGYWSWSSHHAHMEELWRVTEESVAAEAKLRAGLLADLRDLTEETPVLNFAKDAIPHDLVTEMRMVRGDLAEGPRRSYRFAWAVLSGASSSVRHAESELLEQALDAQAYLRKIDGEKWPPLPAPEHEARAGNVMVRQFADEIAELRLARIGITILERRVAKTRTPDLKALGDAGRAVQPLSGELAILRREESGEVVKFPTPLAKVAPAATEGDEDMSSDVLVFRLPPEPK